MKHTITRWMFAALTVLGSAAAVAALTAMSYGGHGG